MHIREYITKMIETNPIVKDIYENSGGCFKHIVLPRIMASDDDHIIEELIIMLATQSAVYDVMLNNIAQFGNQELIKKCSEDINKIYSSEE